MTGKKKMKREETKAGSTRSFKDNLEKQLPRASKKSSSDLKDQTEKVLKERIKELNCFFGISAVMELPNIELDEILKKIVLLLPPAWQFPEITEACIVLEGKSFQTEHFQKTSWMLVHDIIVNDNPVGQVMICYLKESPVSDEGPFMKEERHLLNAIGERLGHIIERKFAEMALKESEGKFRGIFNTINDGIHIHEIEPDGKPGKFIEVNDVACQMLHYSHDEMLEHRPLDFVTGYHSKPLNEIIREQSTTGHSIFETDHLRKDGTIVPVEINTHVVNLQGNRVMVSVIRDITERKVAEKKALLAGEEWGRTFDAVPDLISILDTHHTILRVNKSMADKLGVKPAEAVGLTCYEHVHGTQCPPDFCPHAMLMKDQQEHSVEIFEERLGGHFLVTCTPLRDKDGQLLGSVHVARDITERKRAEVALMKLTSFQESVITNARVWLSVLDPNGNILLWNTAAEEISGYFSDDVVGQKGIWKKIYPDKEYRKKIADTITRIIREKKYLENFETTILSKQGTQKVISWNTRGISDAQGNASSYIAIGVDVTDRKRSEDALHQANRKLNLLYSITRHDINNQISAIAMFLYLAEEGINDTTIREHLQKIEQATMMIQKQIRFTSEYEAIGVNIPIWQDIWTIVESAAKQATLGKVIMKNDLPIGMEVFVDPLIVKVCYNLVDNAVRYGGKITTIRFFANEQDGNHIVVCEDDGDGVVEEEKERIFDRGFGKNAGLGLALAREILSITGITIRETGKPGKGARFEMVVPKAAWRITVVDKRELNSR